MKRIPLISALIGLCFTSPLFALDEKSAEALSKLDFRQIITDAKTKVFPAVIYIRALRESMEGGKKENIEVSGSGVIISPDGKALTNWHVVDKAVDQKVRVLLSDGQHFDAKVLGTDKDVDLAVLQIQLPPGAKPLPCAEIGDSTALKEGDFVMAMGAPWGMNRSVSIGIIACSNRFLPGATEYSKWLQTDASISPGNSGGPLVNTAGKIIGINTRGSSQGGDMGFAVPSETISLIFPQLVESGKVNWSWFGLQLQALHDFNRNIYFDGNEGVIVAETDPESPARRADLRPKDRILKVNGKPVTAMTEEDLPMVRRMFGLLPKGQPARFEILRDKENLTIEITPREKGKVEGEEFECPRWNLTVKTINQFDNPDLYFQRKVGVFIFGAKYPGNAVSAGLRPQDIIVKLDSTEINSLDDLKNAYKTAMDNIQTKHKVTLTVQRGDLTKQFIMDFLRDYEKE